MLLIRANSNQFDKNLNNWWINFVNADDSSRKKMINKKNYA